jgi:hypothetical protein
MKLLFISLVSWLLGLLLLLSTFSPMSQQGFAGFTATDVNSVTVTSLIMTALLFSLAYAPSLSWFRGCEGAWAVADLLRCSR